LLKITGVTSDRKSFDSSRRRVIAQSITFLDGIDATPENIIKQCRELNEKTGENGVIFVYFLCRDAETEKGQILYPQAKSETNLGNGILRKTVFETISKNNHRLCLLITDGCQDENVQYDGGVMSATNIDPIYTFSSLLLYGEGKFNIRSANPLQNEIPLGCKKFEIGTFFTYVFTNCMDYPIEDTGKFDMDKCIKELQDELNIIYRSIKCSQERKQNQQTILMW
jgi:hypothetical protein